jgi:hypothetical protein
MLKLGALATSLAITATGAFAFELKNTQAYVRWDRQDIGTSYLKGPAFGLGGTAMIFDRFGLDFGLETSNQKGRIDNYNPITLNRQSWSVAGNYYFSANAYVGVFVDRTKSKFSLRDNFGSLSISHTTETTYGVQGGYSNDKIAITGYYAISDHSQYTADSDVFGVDFVYSLQNGIDFGGYYQAKKRTGFDYTQYGITAGYLFDGKGSSTPIYLVATLGRLNEHGNEVEQISLAISVPLGGNGVKRGHRVLR